MTIVIGIGNREGGDDAVGPAVADRLSGPVVVSAGDPGSLIEAWKDANWVIIVDAVKTDAPPGILIVRELGSMEAFPEHLRCSSTHGLGLREAVEIGRALDRLPERITLVGVTSNAFECGQAMSPEVEAAVDRAAELVCSLDGMHPGAPVVSLRPG